MQQPPFWRSLGYAAEGILHTVRSQRNARIHVTVLLLVVLAGWAFRISRLEWALVVLVSGLVLALETLNSAVEAFVDMVQPDHHPLAKVVKDASAGAVLLAALTAALVGVLIFGPRVWHVVTGY